MAKQVWKLVISAVLITLLWLGLVGSRAWAGYEAQGSSSLGVGLGRCCEVTLDRCRNRLGLEVSFGGLLSVDVFGQGQPGQCLVVTGRLGVCGLVVRRGLKLSPGCIAGPAVKSSDRQCTDVECDHSRGDAGNTDNAGTSDGAAPGLDSRRRGGEVR